MTCILVDLMIRGCYHNYTILEKFDYDDNCECNQLQFIMITLIKDHGCEH